MDDECNEMNGRMDGCLRDGRKGSLRAQNILSGWLKTSTKVGWKKKREEKEKRGKKRGKRKKNGGKKKQKKQKQKWRPNKNKKLF